MSRLKEQYENEIVPALKKKFEYKNPMEVPKLVKIVVNMGVGEAKENVKLLFARACRLAARSHCAASACMNLQIV